MPKPTYTTAQQLFEGSNELKKLLTNEEVVQDLRKAEKSLDRLISAAQRAVTQHSGMDEVQGFNLIKGFAETMDLVLLSTKVGEEMDEGKGVKNRAKK